MAYVNQSHGAHHGFSTSVTDFFAHIRETIQRHRVYRQTVSELNLLSDRELSDLQLNRSMIHAVAQDAAYGK